MGKGFQGTITMQRAPPNLRAETVCLVRTTLVSPQSKQVCLNLHNKIFIVLEKACNVRLVVLNIVFTFSSLPYQQWVLLLLLLRFCSYWWLPPSELNQRTNPKCSRAARDGRKMSSSHTANQPVPSSDATRWGALAQVECAEHSASQYHWDLC